MTTNVVCAVGLSVNILKVQLIFVPNLIFAIYLNFKQPNLFKNQYFPQLSFKICKKKLY